MMVDCVVIEGEEEFKDYTPGVYGKACLDFAKAHGSKSARWSGGPNSRPGTLPIVQAVLDDSGVWHYWPGT